MKFGLFLPSSRGHLITSAIQGSEPTYGYHRQLVMEAEELGLDFAVAAVKMRGMGGESHFWDEFLDSFTMIAGLAEATERINLFASVGILTMPAPLTARMCTTIDDISGGRFGLNVVTGWAKMEYDQMGIWPGDEHYKDRYERAGEYVDILRELWTTGHSDFKGTYYEMKDCVLGPVPKHDIPVLCAGESDRGLAFTAKHGDVAFVHSRGYDSIRRTIATLRETSADAGREVTAYVNYNVVIADTDELAQERCDMIREGFDPVAFANLTGMAVGDEAGGSSGQMLQADDRAFVGTDVVAGSPATVAAFFDDLAVEIPEVKGIVLVLDDFLEGTRRFGREVLPLMKHARDGEFVPQPQ